MHFRRAWPASCSAGGVTKHVPHPNEVEVGWLVLGRLDPADNEAVREARARTLEIVQRELPEVEWRMLLLERRDLGQLEREEPTELIMQGIDERDAGHLDFVLVVTGADLRAHGKQHFAIGVASRTAGVGVVSTARIDPLARGEDVDPAERRAWMTRRLTSLALHILGDLVGVPHDSERGSAMTPINTVEDLDEIEGYTPQTQQAFAPELRRIADLRLEELREPPRRLRFYLRAAGMNTGAIAGSCWRARPWELPFRLGRLTAAAVSSVIIILITAETWEVALRLSLGLIVALSLVSLMSTVLYALRRQRLLIRRGDARLTEQIVVADVSVVLTLGLGLMVAYVMLFGLAMLLGTLLFPRELIASWADMPEVGRDSYARLAGFAASIGLAIGALGASFESQSYVRHVTYVDEELG